MWLQIIVSIFIALILYRLFRQRQNARLSNASFILWLILWLAVAIVFWQPEITSYLAHIFGIQRGADLTVYTAIVVIFYLLFKIFVRLNKIDSDFTKLVRQDAIKNVKTKNHNHHSEL